MRHQLIAPGVTLEIQIANVVYLLQLQLLIVLLQLAVAELTAAPAVL